MILRLVVLVAVVGAAFLLVRWAERRRTAAGTLAPGLTVVTAEGCTLCDPTVEALRGTGTIADIRVVDVGEAGLAGIKSVPTVLAVRSTGELAMQRSGRSAITDAAALAAAIV
jgi:hypothetical protein